MEDYFIDSIIQSKTEVVSKLNAGVLCQNVISMAEKGDTKAIIEYCKFHVDLALQIGKKIDSASKPLSNEGE